MQKTLLSRIKEFETMSIKELKKEYIKYYGSEKGAHNNKIYLIKKLTFKIQEQDLESCNTTNKEDLANLAEQINPLEDLRKANISKASIKRHKKLPLPGTIIKRIYKGTLIEVKVLDAGFEYLGKNYKSISNLAKVISGTHCSGYEFFKL